MVAGDGEAFVGRAAALDHLVARDAQADHVVVADLLADRLEHLDAEAHAVLEAAAVLVGAPVDQRAPVLVDQVEPGVVQLDAIEAGRLAAPGGLGEVVDHALVIEVLHLLGEAAVQALARDRWRDQRHPVLAVPVHPPAHVDELYRDGGAMRVHRVDQRAQVVDDRIVGQPGDAVVATRRVERDRRGTDLREPDPALRLLGMVADEPVRGLAVDDVTGAMARADDPVADGHALDGQGPQKRVVIGHGGGSLVSGVARNFPALSSGSHTSPLGRDSQEQFFVWAEGAR